MKRFNFKVHEMYKLLTILCFLIVGIGQMWGTDGTFYASPVYMFTSTWNSSTSTMYIKSTTDKSGGGHIEVAKTAMTNTGKTYHGFPVYSYSLSSSSNWAEIILYDQQGSTEMASYGVYGDGWSENFGNVINKIYLGWNGSSHECISDPASSYDSPKTVTLYYAHANTQNYTVKANMRVSGTYSEGTWRTIEMTSTGKTFDGKKIYSCDATIYLDGLYTLQFQRYNGESFADQDEPFNSSWQGTSVFENKIYVNGSGWKPLGTKRTYDGSTYVYWKTSGNDIPSDWGSTGSSTNAIQLLKITNGSYTYSGFQNGEDLGNGFYRYLVPAGDYADVVEIRGKINKYTGEFGFPAEAEENEIWNYKEGEGWASWAQTYFANSAYVYFDNTNSNWGTGSGNYNYLLPGGGGYSALYDMTPISNTHLLCHTSGFSYNDFQQLVFIHTSSSWSGTDGNPEDRKGYADNRTASLPKMMDYGSKLYNLYTPSDAGAKASSEASLTHTSASSYGGLLNSAQTVNTVVKTTGTYESANSKAPISLGSYALTSATAAEASAASLTTSESTDNVSACLTATTTFTVDEENLASGYQFDGWYTEANSGSQLDDDAEYSYTTTGAKTVYARFSAIDYNVTYSAPTNGNYTIKVASGTASSATKTAVIDQTITLAATPNVGYAFESWTVTNTSTSADVTATLLGDGSDDASASFTMPAYGVTITATFVVRYGLYGSLDADGNPAEGMPGWAVSKDFTYSAGTYTCNTESLTKPNSTYKFRILDRRDNFSYGLASKAVIAESTATKLTSGAADAQLATAGRGSYTFTVVEADEGAHPQVTITNPTSYLVHFGTRAFTRDGNADKGGTVTVSDAASDGNTYADGKYIASGETVYVTASDVPTGYNFAGWWDNSSYTGNHFATDNPTNWEVSAAVNAYAKFAAKECTITFDKNGGEGGANGTTGAYDAAMLTITPPHKIGYAFGGYYDAETDNNGSGTKYYNADGTSAKAWNKDTESATTLYAKWTADVKTFKADAASTEWATGSNWAGGAAPTNDYSSVTINGEVVLSTSVHIGELSFGEGGKLTIESTGVLEVAGTITNTDASKIVINTTSSSQGALIYDISTAPYATVNMTIPNTDKFHYIASPVGYVPVDPTFAGKDVYTYAWIEGKGWDKRGFYEGFSGDEVILIKGLSGCTFSGQLRPTTGGSISCTATPANANAQGVNMVPNTLTAPIKIAAMNLSAAYDGAVHIWNGSTWDPYPKSSCGEAVIPALQGYAVLTATGGTVSFTYDAAVRGASSHNDALKAPQRTHSDIQDHITVSVMTNERKENLLLYENNQFSDAIDKGWEALYMEGDGTYGELYAHAKEPMSILATDSLEGIVLGFVPGQAETYTISFEGDGRGYYLNDVKEEEATLIEEGNTYEFAADAATNATRFVISKTPIKKTPTGVDNTNDGVKARKQLIDGTLYIIRDGRLYNTTGALVK